MSNVISEYIDGCGDLKTSISKVMRRAFMDPKETTTDGRGNRIVTKTGGTKSKNISMSLIFSQLHSIVSNGTA